MNVARILVPIDTTKCHPEVFSRVNALAGCSSVTVILLHVINLNLLSPDNRLDVELAAEAHWHLQQLARQFLHPGTATSCRVRFGKPVEEILAEAKAEDVDLMILPMSRGAAAKRQLSFWERLYGLFFAGVGEQLVRAASCPVTVVHADTRLNCHEHWGHRVNDNPAKLSASEAASGTSRRSNPVREALAPETEESQRLAA